MLLQVGRAVPASPLELVLVSSPETQVVLGITALFSLVSWFLIVLKWWQLGRLHGQSARLAAELAKAPTLRDAYQATSALPPSPYVRLLREAVTFVGDLRRGRAGEGSGGGTLTVTQLEALKLQLGSVVAEERDRAAKFLAWLAIIGSTSPLLGLLGTVIGVMNAFLGIASKGSGNLSAVAPGVAEALVATAAGLVAAIPAVIAYNGFVSRVRAFGGELDRFGSDLVGAMAREGLV
ncbi:MAG: MotA/TolQ/ExbB proton channel family protein [Gemmatimonadales bacterium]|nr:MotA/TolQ/ExbB proton channel family protein [Gemmatimonadales bacterium]